MISYLVFILLPSQLFPNETRLFDDHNSLCACFGRVSKTAQLAGGYLDTQLISYLAYNDGFDLEFLSNPASQRTRQSLVVTANA